MNAWMLVFLGIIAVAALAQTAFLIALAIGARRLSARVGELRELIDRELRPTLEELLRVSRNVAEITDIGAAQARRLSGALTGTLDRVQRGSDAVSLFMGRPMGLLGNALAVIKGVRSGIEVYRLWRGGRDEDRGRRQDSGGESASAAADAPTS